MDRRHSTQGFPQWHGPRRYAPTSNRASVVSFAPERLKSCTGLRGKRYESETTGAGDSWQHTKITLHPANPDFEPIVLIGAE